MPQDSVLRAFCQCRFEGKSGPQIITAIDSGDSYRLVLTWASLPGKPGHAPSKWVDVGKRGFKIVTDASLPYEIECLAFLDFDAMTFPATEVSTAEGFGNPDKLYNPRTDNEEFSGGYPPTN